MTPTTQANNTNASLINSSGFRIRYTEGSGDRRIVTVTEGDINSIRYPINGEIYKGNLKYGLGDKLYSNVAPTYTASSCVGMTNSIIDDMESKTYVVYEGIHNGNAGLDIIYLKPSTEYQVMVIEQTDLCYATTPEILTVYTSFEPNKSKITVTVYNNKTRNPIKNSNISIKNKREFIADYGNTDDKGIFTSEDMENGRYEISIVADNYESKILSGIFVQRPEPRRDNNFRIFTESARTMVGGSVERERLKNKNEYIVFLDPLDTTARSYTKYQSTDNPGYLTKI